MTALCPQHDKRAAMTDAEFWAHVFDIREYDAEHWAAYDEDIWAISCARCGRIVQVDDPEERERDAFCDDCADECADDAKEAAEDARAEAIREARWADQEADFNRRWPS